MDYDGNMGENEADNKVTVNRAAAIPKDAAFLRKYDNTFTLLNCSINNGHQVK